MSVGSIGSARVGSGTLDGQYSVWGSSTTDIWAVGGDWYDDIGGKYQHWDGQRWSGVPSASGQAIMHAVWGSGPNDVWAAGEVAIEHWDGQVHPLVVVIAGQKRQDEEDE